MRCEKPGYRVAQPLAELGAVHGKAGVVVRGAGGQGGQQMHVPADAAAVGIVYVGLQGVVQPVAKGRLPVLAVHPTVHKEAAEADRGILAAEKVQADLAQPRAKHSRVRVFGPGQAEPVILEDLPRPHLVHPLAELVPQTPADGIQSAQRLDIQECKGIDEGILERKRLGRTRERG